MDYNGKLRPFYVLRLLYEQTDESHPLSTGEIVDLLDVLKLKGLVFPRMLMHWNTLVLK